MILADETYFELLRSIPHWLFDFTTDLVLLPVGMAYQRWHDRNHHASKY